MMASTAVPGPGGFGALTLEAPLGAHFLHHETPLSPVSWGRGTERGSAQGRVEQRTSCGGLRGLSLLRPAPGGSCSGVRLVPRGPPHACRRSPGRKMSPFPFEHLKTWGQNTRKDLCEGAGCKIMSEQEMFGGP